MWIDTASVAPTDFKLKSMLTQRGFDTNYTSALYWSYICASLDLIVAVVCLWVLYKIYKKANDILEKHWEHVYDENGFDENGYDAEGYDTAGCKDGLDSDGN